MPEPAPSDESLMLAVANGDMRAFEQLVKRHQTAAWRVAVRSVRDVNEAEDLAQQAFLRILDAADRYEPAAAFRTYLYRVLTRLCIDHLRKKRPLAVDPLPSVPSSDLSASQQIERDERANAVQTALDTLPPKYRVAVVLRYFEGLSGTEIAEALNTTPKAVERLLARARKRLEPLLKPLLEE
ncbi:MAG: sigma-70 family RNA polymerase sigma factor [Candidatus Hydrogenedentota bacterium]